MGSLDHDVGATVPHLDGAPRRLVNVRENCAVPEFFVYGELDLEVVAIDDQHVQVTRPSCHRTVSIALTGDEG
jgi:hypothetical protein